MMNKVGKKRKIIVKRIITFFICILLFVLGVIIGIVYTNSTSLSLLEGNRTLNQIVQILEDYWVDPSSSSEAIEDRLMNGLVEGLDDPYTSYMTIDQTNAFMDSIDGHFVGVGISFTPIDQGALILSVFKDAPSYEAGLEKGDIIVKVDDQSIAGLSSDEIKEKVVGKENTKVKLSILREKDTFDVMVNRRAVESDVSYEIKEHYGYLALTTFGDTTPTRVEEALKDFKNHNVKKIVIDLRDNSGGRLDSVQGILNLFIPNNQVMFKMQQKSGEITEFKAKNDQIYQFDEGYILMNEGSASSSEVMIGALSELLHYKTIGTTSYGKGIAQTTVTLANGNSLKYTYARWLTPSGLCIHDTGFTPDIEVKEESISDYSYREFDNKIEYDSVSVDVIYMQKMLKRLGYNVDRNDGYFSLKTKEALMNYQKDYQLECDGIYTYSLAKQLYVSTVVDILKTNEDKCLNKINEIIK